VFYGDPARLVEGLGSTTSALPIEVDDLASLTIDYDLSVASTSRYQLGFRTSQVYGCTVGWCSSGFLEIYLHSDRASDSAYFQKRVTIDGEEYDFYKEINNETHGFHYWFVMLRPAKFGTLRLHAFLDFFVDEGYNEGKGIFRRISYIDLFQNMWGGGSGSTTIHNLSVDVTPRAE
jgi:hypothetical protein